MHIKSVSCAIALAVASLASVQPIHAAKQATPRVVACRLIHTPAQLQDMQNNLAGSYCLANDIDMSSIANFVPIGQSPSFTGQFFGNGHAIRNLTINVTTSGDYAALFATAENAVFDDVRLVNVDITASNGNAAGLVGFIEASLDDTSTMSGIRVSGKVKCTDPGCLASGIAAEVRQGAILIDSSSSADITGNGNTAGGAVSFSNGTITRTYATGRVMCVGTCNAGGLAGIAASTGAITDSFALGTVTAGAGSVVGGLVGVSGGIAISRTFAAGAVVGGTSATVGGLIGEADSDTINASYSVGPVTGGSGATLGGLIGTGSSTVTNSYWDTQTSGQATSAGGIGKTTAQLRTALQTGFGSAWGIVKNLSYPFLNSTHIDYASPLATLVLTNNVFAFLPLGQLDTSQYLNPPAHSDEAALATVYTMIARAVGITDNIATLKGNNGKIDRYFWNDSTQTTTFKGPITSHATLGTLTNIPAASHLNGSNVIPAFNHHQLVILRGTYTGSGGTAVTHWMLGTLYTKTGATMDTVVANDPWTGMQVEIDPETKTVVSPAGFPLTNFKVNGYRVVTIN